DLHVDDGAPVPATAFTDDELVGRINAGDVEASLTELRRRYGKRIYYLVLGILRDAHLAEDVCAEVFEKVFLKSHLYQPGTNFGAWLFEVARNQALSARRARKHVPLPVSGLEPAPHGPRGDDEDDLLQGLANPPEDNPTEEHEMMAAFDRAVLALPP